MKVIRVDEDHARWATTPDLMYVLARGGGTRSVPYIGSVGHLSAHHYTVWL